MDSKVDAYLKKAEKKLALAKNSYGLSTHACMRKDMNLKEDVTFLDETISQAYYSIFFSARAYTESNGLKGTSATTHTRTYEALKKGLDTKKMRDQQISLREAESVSTQKLLDIFILEKNKRGHYTYDLNDNASLDEAKTSIEHAETFFAAINYLLENNGSELK